VLKVGVGDVFADPRTGAMLEVTAWPEIDGPGKLQIRRLLRPGMGFLLPHVHVSVDESFEIEYGIGDFWIGHRTARLGQGQKFHVPRYEVHVGPLNRSMSDLVYVQTIEAARTGAAKRYVETLALFLKEGRDVRGDLPPIVAAAVFAGKDQQTFVPWLPLGFQRDVLFPLAKSFEERRDERRRRRASEKAAREEAAWADW
jgi:mannose-6-phosphate isomerase-like protein (cupin superfamily)